MGVALDVWSGAAAPAGETEFHEELHTRRAEDDAYVRSSLNHWRLGIFEIIRQRHGGLISGEVLDIGAGSGYAGVTLSRSSEVRRVTCLEISNSAVKKLIPKCVEIAGADPNKVVAALGSFDDIPGQNAYDAIVSFGALHHSSNLLRTMRSINAALKPGGYVIAHEPATDDLTPNAYFVKELERIRLPNGDIRHDHFFRRAEWIVGWHHAGFDIIDFEPFSGALTPPKRKLSKRIKHFFKSLFKAPPPPTTAAAHRPQGHYMLLRKPPEGTAPPPNFWSGS